VLEAPGKPDADLLRTPGAAVAIADMTAARHEIQHHRHQARASVEGAPLLPAKIAASCHADFAIWKHP
jgi:hypothetical protein